jgi:hypothetical protein
VLVEVLIAEINMERASTWASICSASNSPRHDTGPSAVPATGGRRDVQPATNSRFRKASRRIIAHLHGATAPSLQQIPIYLRAVSAKTTEDPSTSPWGGRTTSSSVSVVENSPS